MTKRRGTNAQRAYDAAQPSKTDKTISTKPVAAKQNSLSDQGLRDQAIHMILLNIHFGLSQEKIQAVLMREMVVEARKLGATWQEIGDAYGVSAQAAWQKHRPSGPRAATDGQPGETQELPFD